MNIVDLFFDNLMVGNASVITVENIEKLNKTCMDLYSINSLNKDQIEILKKIIMICNVLYNRTDMTVLPVEDGFYDLLLEKYKKYDPNFQVGSAIVDFRNFIENDIEHPRQIASCPVIFDKSIDRDETHQYVFDNIMRTGRPILNRYDFFSSPVEFENSYISKRTHNTVHNHPSLVGTLHKCKFVFNQDAIDAGCFEDSNVRVLERDFFQDHINKGIIRADQEIEIVAELKYDGISVEADCGLEVMSARTRGDTGIGAAADISPILKGYTFKQAKCMIGENPIGIKFEAIITKSNLAKFNELRGREYSNGRTAIVGLFGASDAYMFRDLITLVPLAVDRDDVPSITNRLVEIEFLNKIFANHGQPLRYCYFKGTVSEVLYMIKCFSDEALLARNYLDFMYDGIVISYLDENIRARLGRKNFINEYSIAVKFEAKEKQTIFRGYTYTVGQHGTITPMIHYDPIEFMGTIHDKSTGSSLDRITKMGLKYGDIISVKYVNDVMPYVYTLDCEHNRNNPNPVVEPITKCPICGSDLVISDSGKTIKCVNPECLGKSIKRMVNMFAKMNIKGFAEASFGSLNIDHLYMLFNYGEDYYINKLGVADGSSFYNQLSDIKSGKESIKDYIVMGALGFTSIAHKSWKNILNRISLKDLYAMYLSCKTEEQFKFCLLQAVPNVGDITSQTIAREFPFFEKDIIEILSWPSLVNSIGAINENSLQIRFTGIRNKQLSEQLCNAGYDADDSSSVTKNTDILLVPYDGFSSSKTNKVSEKCRIIPIDEFMSNMDKYLN